MIKNIKNFLLNLVQFKHLNVLILFLFFAFIVSIISKLSNQVTQTFQVELVPKNLYSTEILTENSSKYVYVTIKDQGFNMLKYVFEDLKADVDFNNLEKDASTYYWTKNSNGFNLSTIFNDVIEIKDISPSIIPFSYDIQSIKKVPVIVNVDIEFALGYNLVNPLESKPDSITVVGPKIIIDTISSIFTKNLKFNELKENINTSVELKNLNKLKFSNTSVKVLGKIDKFTEGKLNVAVNVINLPPNYGISVFPKVVPVVFYVNLSNYNSIKPSDFIVECDFNKMETSSNLLIPRLVSFPEIIKEASIQVSKLEFVMIKK